MRRAPILPSLLLVAITLLPACAAGPISVTTQPTGCAALIPPSWLERVQAPDFSGDGNSVADWMVYGDAVTGRLGQANDRTEGAIHIVTACEARDAAAIHQATRRKFLGLF